MPYACLEKQSLYRSLESACQKCNSQHPCPPLIVIAMRYSKEIVAPPVSGK